MLLCLAGCGTEARNQRHASYCEQCREEKRRAKNRRADAKRRPARAAYYRSSEISRRYGITQDDYDRMLEAQGGVCAVCREACSTGQRLCIDHDHETGRVRKLLCRKCNLALGFSGESPARILALLRYAEEVCAR